MKIKAKLDYIQREKHRPPSDGVHCAGKDGWIKGVHSLRVSCLGRATWIMPKGSNAAYWYDGGEWGLKFYFSFSTFKPAKKSFVEYERSNMKKFHKLGFAPKIGPTEVVSLDLDYTHDKKHIKTKALAVPVEHVWYPEEAWADYAMGRPFDWSACGDWCTPESSIEFRQKLLKAVKKHKIPFFGSAKLGDILPCVKKERFFLVDAGR